MPVINSYHCETESNNALNIWLVEYFTDIISMPTHIIKNIYKIRLVFHILCYKISLFLTPIFLVFSGENE